MIEWVAAGVGLLITLGLIGFIGWQAFRDPGGPPQLEVRVKSIAAVGDSYLVNIVVENRSSQTVAELNVEGTLATTGEEPEKTSATFDYIPGDSEAQGGLIFESDPTAGELQLRPKGYRRP